MICSILRSVRDRLFPIRAKGENNHISSESKFGRGFLVMVTGNNNDVVIGKNCLLTNTVVIMRGDNNRLVLHDKARFMGPCRIFLCGGGESCHW